jgi:hypothetical protein
VAQNSSGKCKDKFHHLKRSTPPYATYDGDDNELTPFDQANSDFAVAQNSVCDKETGLFDSYIKSANFESSELKKPLKKFKNNDGEMLDTPECSSVKEDNSNV